MSIKSILMAAAAVSTVAATSTSALMPAIDATVTTAVSHNTKNVTTELTAVRADLQEKLEAKRLEAKEKVEAKKAEVKEKLADKRLDACKKREARINTIIDKTATQSEKHLAVFEKIEERVKTFYTDKQLTAQNYDTLTAAVDEKHTAAVAAIDELKANDFSCDTTDASNPAGLMKELAQSKNDALKEYRTALKDLIVAIKGASTKASTDATESESTETTEGTN
jgi:hypothetical protein